MVGLSGVEPLTSRLSGARSNQLSYRPPRFVTHARCISRLARSEGTRETSRAKPGGRFARARSSPEKIRIAHVCVELLETTWRLGFGARHGIRRPRGVDGSISASAYCHLERRLSICFFFNDTATTEIYTLSLHDALPTSP